MPDRPPPPAPVRQTSFQAVNNFLVQGISFGSQRATAEAAANSTTAKNLAANNTTENKEAVTTNQAYRSTPSRDYENQKITQVDGRQKATAQKGNT